MNRLKIGSGARAGEVIDLASGGLTIGDDASAASVAFRDAGLASVHFRVAPVKGGGFGIQDLGSPEGTYVNGKKVAAHRLVHGDQIHAGGMTLTFESSDSVASLYLAQSKPSPSPGTAPLTRTPEPTLLAVKLAASNGHDTPAAGGPRPSDPDLTGKVLGGYQIEKILGRGGMGTVYRATQTSLHRTVALKVLSPTLARDPKFVELFLKEARSAAQLHHPNVVTIYDVGSDGQYHYFSMEVFEGGSVEQILKREKKIEVGRALAMTRDAASALDFAEAKRVLHRDVKPDNLMLSAHGVVKLADLGLAVRQGAAANAARIGTPHFLAPECIRGGPVDHRADLYALGATLFRMLTGRTPFQGANVNEILEAAQTVEAPALRTLDATIPEPVEALVAKLLQKDPVKRMAKARDVIAAIDAIVAPRAGASSTKSVKIAASIAGAAALAVVALIVFKPKDKESSTPTIVRDTATEARLIREKEDKERELRDKDGELALAMVPSTLTPVERVARFEAIANDFAGTPAGVKAAQELERARKDEQARLNSEKDRAAAVSQYREKLEKQVQDKLSNGDFAAAIAAPRTLEGFQAAQNDPDAKAATDIVPERVGAAVETKTKDDLNRALELRTAGKLDEAYRAYEQLAAKLRSLLALPRDLVSDALAARFQTLLTSVEGSLKEVERGRDEFNARSLTAARASAAAALRAAFESARGGKSVGLTALLAMDGASLGDPELCAVFSEAQLDAKAFSTFLTRLQDANATKDFGAESFHDPLTGKPARIVGFDDSGLRVEPKPGALPVAIPFEKLGAARMSQLFARMALNTNEDGALLSRATFFAACAFDTGRLAEYQRSLKLNAASFEPPPESADDAFQAATGLLRAVGDGSAAGVETIRKRIELERAATTKLREGLTAFSSGRYDDAARVLSEFLTTARGSLAYFLAASPNGKDSPGSTPVPPK